LLSLFRKTLSSTSPGSILYIQRESAKSTILKNIFARNFFVSFFESLTPILDNSDIFKSLMAMPATINGPIIDPRPASSTPPIKISFYTPAIILILLLIYLLVIYIL
jgi:hypothetical protein